MALAGRRVVRLRAPTVAWSIWALIVSCLVFTAIASEFQLESIAVGTALLPMPTIGAFVAARKPENPIGWLFLGLAACWAVTTLSDRDVGAAGIGNWTFPGAIWLLWIGSWAWVPAVIGTLTFPFLLFPTGRFLSPRWRVVGWLAAATIVIFVANAGLSEETVRDRPNPARVDVLVRFQERAVYQLLNYLASVSFLVLLVAPVTSVVLRLRQARGVERQQLRWFAYTALLLIVGVLGVPLVSWVVTTLGGFNDVWSGTIVWSMMPAVAIIGLPLTIGLAMLRYHLYDIDRVVNRAIVYTVLTMILIGTYLGAVLTLSTLARILAGETSPLVTAGSTLGVAALFRPLRARIQVDVDRRFYRRRYDATRTVEAFAARLRDEIDLPSLSDELQAVVSETMQPAHVALWLRAAAARGGRV